MFSNLIKVLLNQLNIYCINIILCVVSQIENIMYSLAFPS